MDGENQVELSMVLGRGDFTLRVNGASIRLRLEDLGGGRTVPHLEVRPLLPAGDSRDAQAAPAASGVDEAGETARLEEEAAYYRQTSQEIYEGLGKLAKEINLSIQDLSLTEIMQAGLTSPEEGLDQVRSQVTDVLEMTEKATLNILNLVETIQEDCLKVQGQLAHLAATAEAESNDAGRAAPTEDEAESPWPQLLSQGEALDRQLRACFPEPAETAEAGKSGEVSPSFPLADILQMLLEFCGTEAVKPHLKTVQAQSENLFRMAEAEGALAALAANSPQEDGFFQLPVDKVLAILHESCTDERIKELFTKLLASAGKIFPVATLPVEAQAPASASEVLPQPEMIADQPGRTSADFLLISQLQFHNLWQAFYETLKKAVGDLQRAGSPDKTSGTEENLSHTVREALATVEHIHNSLARITEALSFQDLSGQRLLKVLNILRQLQVQVLTLLLAAGNKLKVKVESDGAPFKEQEIKAQETLDRMLHAATAPEAEAAAAANLLTPAEQPLDQEAINNLLTGMGF
jgi:chemotaxis regulatin CheY-phosphate phosphatase CheZ